MSSRSIACALVLVAACAGVRNESPARRLTTLRDAFDETGFAPRDMGYRVRYAGARCRLVSERWRIGNAATDERGCPRAGVRVPGHHLVLQEVEGGGVLWIRAVPLAPIVETTALDVLADNYVSGSQGGYFGPTLVGEAIPGVDRRFPGVVHDRMSMRLDGRPARARLVDAASVRPQPGEASRGVRALIVFARLSATYPRYEGFAERNEPMLLVVGYVNGRAAFEARLPDFEQLLRAVDLLE